MFSSPTWNHGLVYSDEKKNFSGAALDPQKRDTMEKGRELINQLNVIIERSVKAKKAGEDNDVIIFGNRVVTIVGIPLLCAFPGSFFFFTSMRVT